MKIAGLAGNLAFAAVSIGLCFIAAEFAARWERSRGGGVEDNALSQYMKFDARLGWRKVPGAEVTYRRREYRVQFRINSAGLRDRERPRESTPVPFRLLVLGDSFVEGYTVPLEQTVTQVLERRLRDAGCNAEVLNGGTAGYSTDQELLYWRGDGSRFAPRIVALFVYYNDVVTNDSDNYYGRLKPRFTVEGGTLRLTNVPLPEPTLRKASADEVPAESPFRSAAYEWLHERLLRGSPAVYDRLATLGLWPRLVPDEPGLKLRVYKTGPTPYVDGAWRVTEHLLGAFRQEVEATGARFFVVHVPNRMEVKDVDRELMARAYGMTDDGWSAEGFRRAQPRALAAAQPRFPRRSLPSPRRALERTGTPHRSRRGGSLPGRAQLAEL